MARKRRKSQQQKQNRTLRTEKLEDRIVFSGCTDVQYTGNNHLYLGTNYDDQIVVDFTGQNAGTITRTSTINGSPVNAQPVQFSYSNLTTIDSSDPFLVIKGLKGDDTITINDNGFTPPGSWFDMNGGGNWCAKYVAVYGDEGMDTIEGSRFGEHLSGGPGKDTILSGGAAWHTGNSILYFDYDQIYGGSGDDALTGGDGIAIIHGDSGNDTITNNGSWQNYLYGGSGNDIIKGGSGYDQIHGGDGHDKIHGGAGSDTIFGDSGNDKIYGDGGNDVLSGGDGYDWLYGGSGKDRINGQNHNDVIFGGSEKDTIFGDSGNDRI